MRGSRADRTASWVPVPRLAASTGPRRGGWPGAAGRGDSRKRPTVPGPSDTSHAGRSAPTSATRRRSPRREVLDDASRAMRFAYADPPYPGKAHHYPERDDVDHQALVERLACEFADGWALSTSAAVVLATRYFAAGDSMRRATPDAGLSFDRRRTTTRSMGHQRPGRPRPPPRSEPDASRGNSRKAAGRGGRSGCLGPARSPGRDWGVASWTDRIMCGDDDRQEAA